MNIHRSAAARTPPAGSDRLVRAWGWLLFAVLVLLLAACSRDKAGDGSAAKAAPEAGYMVLKREAVPLQLGLAARTAAFETSEVRPQVSGIIQARLFTEGATVHAGDLLYQIDPRLYEATLSQARADLASAVATRDAARVRADRFGELARSGVISRQDLLDAQATADSAAAAAERARAMIATAEINLEFTKVSAPITGRIGRSVVTTGALVSAGQAAPLTTIQRLDPIFVDIQQSSAALLSFRRQVAGGDLARTSTAVNLVLEDGSRYPRNRRAAIRGIGSGYEYGHRHGTRPLSQPERLAAAGYVCSRGVLTCRSA
ncbi:MAG: efflux RND transporter periplasmic adaptor subunit [Gammaproteobacteria bacterium]